MRSSLPKPIRHVLMPAAMLLALSACNRSDPQADAGTIVTDADEKILVFAGEGRDRLCLAQTGGRASFITYAASGDANCSIRGEWSPSGPQAIRPQGDPGCSIIFNRDDHSVTLLAGGPACDYYCGPGASFAGKTFVRMDRPGPVTDLAGDPLC